MAFLAGIPAAVATGASAVGSAIGAGANAVGSEAGLKGLTAAGTVAGGVGNLLNATKEQTTPGVQGSSMPQAAYNFQQYSVPQNPFGSSGQSGQGYQTLLQMLQQMGGK